MLKLVAVFQNIGNPKFIHQDFFYGLERGGKVFKSSLSTGIRTYFYESDRAFIKYFDEDAIYFGESGDEGVYFKEMLSNQSRQEIGFYPIAKSKLGIFARENTGNSNKNSRTFSWRNSNDEKVWSIEHSNYPQLAILDDMILFYDSGNGYNVESINLADGSTNWAFQAASLPPYKGTYGEAKADGYVYYAGTHEGTLFFGLKSGNLCTIKKDGSGWTFHTFNPLWFQPHMSTFLGRSLYYAKFDAIIEYDLDTRAITSHANLDIGLPEHFYAPAKPIFFKQSFLIGDRDTVYYVNLAERKLIDSFSLAGIEHFNGAIWNIQYSENHLLVQDYDKTVFVFAFEAPE